MTLPDPKDLQAAWVELQKIHKEHLAIHNVKLPRAKHYSDSAKSLWLAKKILDGCSINLTRIEPSLVLLHQAAVGIESCIIP